MMQHDPSVPTAYAVHNGSPSHPPPVVSPHPSVLVNSYQLQQQQQQQPAASANNAAYQTQMQMQYANQTSSPHHPQLQQHPMSLIQHPQPNGAASTAAPASRALFNPTSTGVTAVMQANINPNDPNAQGSYLLHPAYQQLQQVPSSHADLMRSHDEQQRQLQYAAQQQQQQSQHEQMMYHQQQMIQAQQQQQQRQHQQQLALARQSQTSPHMQMVPPSQQVILQTQSQPQQQTTQQLLYQQPPPIAVPPPLHIIPTSVHAPSLSILTPLASPRSSLPPLLTKRTSVGAASPKFQTRPEELYQPPQCYSPLTATTPKSMSFPGLYQSALSKASAQLLSCVSTPSTPTSTSMTTMANLYSKERYGIMYRPVDHALMHDTHIIRHAHPTYEYVPVHAEPVPPPAAAAAIPEEDEAMPQSSPMSTGFMSDLLAATNSTKKKAVAQAPVKAQPAVQPPIVKEKLKRKPEVAEPVAAEQPLQPAAKKKKVKAVAAEVKPRVNTVTATPVAVVAPSPSKGHKPIDAPAIPPSPSNASATAPTDPPASTTPVLAPSIPSPSLMASPATKERQSRTSKLAISNEVLEELAASIAQAKKKDRKAAHGTSSTPSTPLAAPAPAPASMTDSTESTALPPVKEESTPDQVENGTSSNDAKMKTEDDAMDTNTENGVETVAAAKTELSTASTETTADAVINDESGDKSEQPHVNGTAAKKASSSKKKKPQVAATTTAPSGASEDQVAPSGNSSAVGEEKESMTDEERRLAELKRAEELNEKYISKYLTLYDQSAAFANRDGRTRHQVTANASPAEALLKKKGAKREREFNPKSVIQQIKQDMKAIVQKSKQSTSSSTNNSEAGAVGTHSSASSVAANDTAATASEAKAPAPATDTAADDVASTVAGESLAPSTSSPPLTGRKRGRPPRKPQVVVTNSNEIVENHNKEVSSQPSTPALTAKPSTKPVSPVEEKGSKGESESDEDSDDDSDSDDDDTTSSSEDEEEEPRPRKRLSELDRLHLANQSVFHAEEKERKKRLKAEKKKAAAAAAAAASAAASTSVVAPGATTPTSSDKKR